MFSVDVRVAELPVSTRASVVRTPVNFSRLLKQAGATGAVDERSIELLRVLEDGKTRPVPAQFSPDPQPRAKRRTLLDDRSKELSVAAEWAAGETPPQVEVAGTLTWLTVANSSRQRFRLRYGVLEEGRVVQVPFPPHNLRVFAANGTATAVKEFPRMQIRPQWPLDGKLRILDGATHVTTLHVGPSARDQDASRGRRRPFLYPVNGADGVSLTEMGKPHDPTGSHAHHNSLWIAHAAVGGHDFWSERGGRIVHDDRFELLEDGPVYCRAVQKLRWIHQGQDQLHETRTLTVYRADGDDRLLDFELSFQPPGKESVELGQTPFGFLAVRVAPSMTVFDGGGQIVNSAGKLNERGAHQQRARWIDLSGPVTERHHGGVALLDHPDNPNHPTHWHCRDDGWAGASLTFAGPLKIKSGKPLELRYRVVLHRGDARAARIDERFAAFAAQPKVAIGKPAAEAR